MNIIKACLNGIDIYHAFISGARKIISDRVYLNKINVFPVPDGDTGTNLAVTMDQIVRSAECSESVEHTVRSIYDASLKGARGNSGMIFASFFNGLQKYAKGRQTLSMNEFSDAIFYSVDSAYAAVAVPVEGTMLTVLKDWASSIRANLPQVFHFGELIEKSLQDARDSLVRTKQKLEVLKKANVVDSGGKGIVDFIEGIVDFFRAGGEDAAGTEEEAPYDPDGIETDIEGRYCMEVFAKNWKICREDIRSMLDKVGSSVVLAGDPEEMKIHVHTDTPEDVIAFVNDNSEIVSHKVDDMEMQKRTMKNKYEIALVTDSIADVPRELIDKYMIHVVPLSLFIDGVEYFDKVTMRQDEFYDAADKAETFPTSSQPPVSKFDEVFSLLSERYGSIIGFFVSSKLSGTYQNALKASEKLKDTGYKIDVIDSLLNSGAQGLVLIKLAEMIHIGRPHDEIVAYAGKLIKKARIYVSVADFRYMVRGGRVSRIKGMLAGLLNLKPIVSLDKEGRGVAFDKAFSVKAIEKKILKLVKEAHDAGKVTSYCIVCSLAEKRASRIAGHLEEIVGIKPLYITEISSVVGISAGRGAAAVAYITER